jgi:hypothetical protein
MLQWQNRSRNHIRKILPVHPTHQTDGSVPRGVRHSACTVPNLMWICHPISDTERGTSNLEQHYIRGGLDHKELGGRLTVIQQMERGVHLGDAGDGNMVLSRVWNGPAYDVTLLMQGAQYPTCNLVMTQLYQMSLACLICE